MVTAQKNFFCTGILSIVILMGFSLRVFAEEVNWQGPAGITIKNIRYPDQTQPQTESLRLFSLQSATAAPYPEPPLAGFSPLIVITTSDEQGDASAMEYEHVLESAYVGDPLNGTVEPNYIIGIYDSGAIIDLFAGASAETVGLTDPYLTVNSIPLGGVGGETDALLSYPVGIFAAGLDAINSNGSLQMEKLKGHSNVSVGVAPEISCDTGESITGVVGTPFVSFYTAVIRNDTIRKVARNGKYYASPDIQLYNPASPSIPDYPRKISMEVSGLSLITTAVYFPDPDPEDLETPFFPTMLGMQLSIPFGGAFFSTIYSVEGQPGPTNPIQDMRVMVDTGAQSSIISPGMAANLSLPSQPDFTVDVCGVGGTVTDVPGYFIDYVKINALGGALEFSNAPFVVLDVGSPDGQPMDGVLGMNFFWNRNIIFDPSLTASSLLQVSDPVPYGNADFDFDDDVNLADFSLLASTWAGQQPQTTYLPVCDLYTDGRIDMRDLEAFMEHWLE